MPCKTHCFRITAVAVFISIFPRFADATACSQLFPKLDVPKGKTLFLSALDIRALDLSMDQIIDLIREMFTLKHTGEAQIAPKTLIHPNAGKDDYVTGMPGTIQKEGTSYPGVKAAMTVPENAAWGMDAFNGFITLFNGRTGQPRAIADARWVTGMRTAAASAVAADALSSPHTQNLSIIGCGVQARTHVEAMLIVRPGISKVHVFDIRREAAEKFKAEIEERFDIDVIVHNELETAVSSGEILVTATKITDKPNYPIHRDWIKKGTFVTTLDFDAAIDPMFYQRAKLMTDDILQMDAKRAEGFFSETPQVELEVASYVAGERRRNPEDSYVFLNLGIATSDVAVLKRLTEIGLEQGRGQFLDYPDRH